MNHREKKFYIDYLQASLPNKKFSPYHGARTVKGGTPFAYGNETGDALAVFTEVNGGGKSGRLECGPFMQDAIGWLLR